MSKKVTEQDRIDYERRVTAYHEAGHVLAFAVIGKKHGLKVAEVVGDASIKPKRSTNGRVRPVYGFYWGEEAVIFYAGHAAELEFGLENPLWGWMRDYEMADEAIRNIVRHRRSDKLGIPMFAWQVKPDTHAARKEWRRKMRVTEAEIAPHAKRFKAQARRLVAKHRDYVENVARLLIERETVEGKELPEL
jgi:ATP-dependent Zn protease